MLVTKCCIQSVNDHGKHNNSLMRTCNAVSLFTNTYHDISQHNFDNMGLK